MMSVESGGGVPSVRTHKVWIASNNVSSNVNPAYLRQWLIFILFFFSFQLILLMRIFLSFVQYGSTLHHFEISLFVFRFFVSFQISVLLLFSFTRSTLRFILYLSASLNSEIFFSFFIQILILL